MAEAIARRAVAEQGWRGFQVRSAGTGAFDGDRISGGALRAAAGHGIDLSSHAATRFMHELGEWADLVLVMSPSHLMRIAQLGGGQNAALITAFAGAGGEGGQGSVPDPIGGPDEEYVETWKALEHLIVDSLRRLEPVVAP